MPEGARSLKSDCLPLEVLLLPSEVFPRSLISLFRHLLSDLRGVLPGKVQLEDFTDDGGRHLINHPLLRVCCILLISIPISAKKERRSF